MGFLSLFAAAGAALAEPAFESELIGAYLPPLNGSQEPYTGTYRILNLSDAYLPFMVRILESDGDTGTYAAGLAANQTFQSSQISLSQYIPGAANTGPLGDAPCSVIVTAPSAYIAGQCILQGYGQVTYRMIRRFRLDAHTPPANAGVKLLAAGLPAITGVTGRFTTCLLINPGDTPLQAFFTAAEQDGDRGQKIEVIPPHASLVVRLDSLWVQQAVWQGSSPGNETYLLSVYVPSPLPEGQVIIRNLSALEISVLPMEKIYTP